VYYDAPYKLHFADRVYSGCSHQHLLHHGSLSGGSDIKIKEYIEKNHLLPPGGLGRNPTKGQRAKQRKKMRHYWLYKDTTFDE